MSDTPLPENWPDYVSCEIVDDKVELVVETIDVPGGVYLTSVDAATVGARLIGHAMVLTLQRMARARRV